jgi:putative glycosyltransferase (TIGR04372 family)
LTANIKSPANGQTDPRPLLVVGQDSVIGSALLHRLRQSGVNAWGTSRRPSAAGDNTLLYDLADPKSFFPTDLKFQAAILCAGSTRLSDCQENPALTRKVNINGILRAARALLERGAYVLFLSTDAVFDGSSLLPGEEIPTSPCNEYGRQKAEAEARLLALAPQQVAICRLNKVLAPETPIIRTFLGKISRGESMPAFSNLKMSPVSLDYVIGALARMLAAKQAGIFHLSGGDDLTYLDLARRIAVRTGADEALVCPVPAPASIHIKTHAALGMRATSALFEIEPQPIEAVLESLIPLSPPLWKKSLEQRAAGRFREALELLKGAVEAAPSRVELLVELGEVYFKMNRSEEGLACWRDAAPLARRWGSDLTMPDQLKAALDEMSASCLMGENRAEIHLKIVEILIGRSRFQEAFSIWEQLFHSHPQWLEAHKRITAAFVFCGEIPLANASNQRRMDWYNAEAERLQLNLMGIRFLREFTTNIGHMGFLDAYVKAGLLGMRSNDKPVLLFGRKPLANSCYIEYWRKYIPEMISSPESFGLLEGIVDYVEDHVHGFMDEKGRQQMSFFYGRYAEILGRWEREQGYPLLALTEDHAGGGRNCLKEMGVPEDAWYVGLHVRHDDWDYIRNANIMNYLPAIEAITAAGGWVIRMGDPGMTPLPPLPHVVDYALGPYKSDWMDVFLWATSRFFVGTISGPYQIPPTFGKPCVLSNIAPIVGTPTYCRDIKIFKRYFSRNEKRFLTYRELAGISAGFVTSAGHLSTFNIELKENSPEEIREAVQEMIDRLNGSPEPLDEKAQADANAIFTGLGVSNGTIGSAFLRRHASLFGRA